MLNGLMRRQELPAGARLMASDTHGDSAYVIRHGAVKVHVEQEDGHDVIVAILGPERVSRSMTLISPTISPGQPNKTDRQRGRVLSDRESGNDIGRMPGL